jgi:hypothetical protein
VRAGTLLKPAPSEDMEKLLRAVRGAAAGNLVALGSWLCRPWAGRWPRAGGALLSLLARALLPLALLVVGFFALSGSSGAGQRRGGPCAPASAGPMCAGGRRVGRRVQQGRYPVRAGQLDALLLPDPPIRLGHAHEEQQGGAVVDGAADVRRRLDVDRPHTDVGQLVAVASVVGPLQHGCVPHAGRVGQAFDEVAVAAGVARRALRGTGPFRRAPRRRRPPPRRPPGPPPPRLGPGVGAGRARPLPSAGLWTWVCCWRSGSTLTSCRSMATTVSRCRPCRQAARVVQVWKGVFCFLRRSRRNCRPSLPRGRPPVGTDTPGRNASGSGLPAWAKLTVSLPTPTSGPGR